MIELRNVTKIYDKGGIGEITAVKDISLQIGTNGIVSIFGPSGCGKTTLLNLIGGLDKPTSGEVLIDGMPIDDKFRLHHIGCVFQDFVLIDHLTVAENIRLLDKSITDVDMDQTLISLGILGLKERKASMLSGGEKQRVCLARAIIKKPSFLIADEPTGNLDNENREGIMRILKSLSKHFLIILVSHEKDLVEQYSDRIIQIEDGRIAGDFIKRDLPNEPFSIGKESLPKVPKRRLKRKKSNFLGGLFSTMAVIATCLLGGLIVGKGESTNHETPIVYRMEKAIGIEDRVALSEFAYFGNHWTNVSGLEVGDNIYSTQGFVGSSIAILPYDLYEGATEWKYDYDSLILTEYAGNYIIDNAFTTLNNSYANLKLSQYGFQNPEELIGLNYKNGMVIKEIVPGNERVCYINPWLFYRNEAYINIGDTDSPNIVGFLDYPHSITNRLGFPDISNDVIYVPSSHNLAAYSNISIGGKIYPIEVLPFLEGREEVVLPDRAYYYLCGGSIEWAYTWNVEVFGKLIKKFEEAKPTSLFETEDNRIKATKITIISIVGSILGVSLIAAIIFYYVDLNHYFESNKNEFLVYRCLGLKRASLFGGSLSGVLLGALPSIVIGSLLGLLLTIFLCRNDMLSLFFLPHVLTFLEGIIVAILFVTALTSLFLWKRLSPEAAEFKRVNQESKPS